MAVSKVRLNGTTLIDLTGDTVTADKLLSGYTATRNDGVGITGTYSLRNIYTVGSLWATEDEWRRPWVELGFGTWTMVSPVKATWNRLKQTTTWAEMAMDAPTVYVWKRTA